MAALLVLGKKEKWEKDKNYTMSKKKKELHNVYKWKSVQPLKQLN